ncbi:hypothetical protein ONZ45_g4889 [Pleurotus djamor]|nr:hypothetical protein ONZ45_g4889 [Pleurotus djamor]
MALLSNRTAALWNSSKSGPERIKYYQAIPLLSVIYQVYAQGSASSRQALSPILSHRQIPSPTLSNPPPKRPPAEDEDEEDNILESLVGGKAPPTPKTLSISLDSVRPSEKRRRDDEDDDGLLGRLAKMKKQDQAKDAPSLGSTGRTKPGDDPPKKIKLKFGLGSVAVVQSPSPSPNTPSPDTPSAPPEGGVKDGDTG